MGLLLKVEMNRMNWDLDEEDGRLLDRLQGHFSTSALGKVGSTVMRQGHIMKDGIQDANGMDANGWCYWSNFSKRQGAKAFSLALARYAIDRT